MKTSLLLLAALAAVSLSACGGGGDDSAVRADPADRWARRRPPTPAVTDFNAYAVSLAQKQDAASERAAPESLDNRAFTFDESATAFAAVFPAN